jgi:hypothetical protein
MKIAYKKPVVFSFGGLKEGIIPLAAIAAAVGTALSAAASTVVVASTVAGVASGVGMVAASKVGSDKSQNTILLQKLLPVIS